MRYVGRLSPTRASLGTIVALGLGGAMVTPLLPVYVADSLGAGTVAVGIVVAAPLVGLILVQPFAGQVGDHLGGRILVLVGLGVFVLATAAYAYPPSLALLVGFRLLAGVGSGLVVIGTLKAVVDDSPSHRRGESVSVYSLATNASNAVGPVVGTAVATISSFGGATILSALVAMLGVFPARGVPRQEHAEQERRTLRFSVDALTHRPALRPSAVLAIGFVGTAVVFTLVPLYLSQMGSNSAGWALAAFALAITAVRLLARRVPDRLGHRACSVLALSLIGLGLGTMAATSSLAGVVAAVSVIGVGHGFAYPALVASVMLVCSEDERATALGTFTGATHAGFVAWCIAVGVLAAAVGMQATFAIAGLAALSGIAIAVRLPTAEMTPEHA